MNLLSSKLQKASAVEQTLLDKLMVLCQFDGDSTHVKVDMGSAFRNKHDPYLGSSREQLITAEFFKTNAQVSVGQFFTLAGGERYRINELFEQTDVSRIFVVVSA